MQAITKTIGKIWDEMCDKSDAIEHLDSIIRYEKAKNNGFNTWHESE